MLRVTLESDPGRKICMPFGYEVSVPMHFGSVIDPAQMVNFSSPRQELDAERKEYWLIWDDNDMRTTLMDEGVAIHYFGNPQARSRDNELVRKGQLPEFNRERLRVACVWGDYLYSDMHGPYTTVRIRVPDMPVVSIVPVTQAALAVPGAPIFRPHEFLRFEELLSPEAERELAALATRRPVFVATPPPQIDLANLSHEQIAALAEQLRAFGAVNGKAKADQAFQDHRDAVAARAR